MWDDYSSLCTALVLIKELQVNLPKHRQVVDERNVHPYIFFWWVLDLISKFDESIWER